MAWLMTDVARRDVPASDPAGTLQVLIEREVAGRTAC